MSWIDDIIESLPAKYEATARLYLPILKRMGRQEVEGLLGRITNEKGFYKLLVENMTTDEIVAEQDRCNEALKSLNKENAGQVALGWQIIGMLLSIAFGRLED